jgi:hypothetical protein
LPYLPFFCSSTAICHRWQRDGKILLPLPCQWQNGKWQHDGKKISVLHQNAIAILPLKKHRGDPFQIEKIFFFKNRKFLYRNDSFCLRIDW